MKYLQEADCSSETTSEVFSYIMHNSVIERIVEKCQSCEILDQVVAANAHKDISPILKRYITYTIML